MTPGAGGSPGEIGGTHVGDHGGAFYDPTMLDVNVAGQKTLTWMGFPRETILPSNRDDPTAAYEFADPRPDTDGRQDEYFEWRVDRNAARKIRKVTFVTEVPEYYEQLWSVDPDAVVAVYRNLVSPAVTRADLGGSGAVREFLGEV